MERYWVANGILASNECGSLVKYDDAQRALDVEREKVAFLEKKNANLVEASNLVLKVKAEIKRVKMDQHTYRSEERCLVLGSLETVLNALQRGRGGKG